MPASKVRVSFQDAIGTAYRTSGYTDFNPSYNIPGVFVPGNDPDAIYDAAGDAIARARRGEGPTLLEIETCRLEGHFMGDAEQYRPQGEVENLKSNDPIPRYRQQLISDGFATAELDVLEQSAARDVSDAFAFARSAELPTVEEAFHHVFAAGAV